MLELDGTLIIAMLSFIVFAFIMNAVLYQPIIKILEERKAFLDNNASTEKNANEEIQNICNKKQAEILEAKSKASKIVSENSEQLKNEQKKITDDFAKSQKENVENQKQQISFEKEKAKQELKASVLEISDAISEKILGGRNV